MEENENSTGLSQDDRENLKLVLDDLIDCVVKFNSMDEPTEGDFAQFMSTLDFGKFIVSGIVYSNGMDLCADHDHDDEEGGVE